MNSPGLIGAPDPGVDPQPRPAVPDEPADPLDHPAAVAVSLARRVRRPGQRAGAVARDALARGGAQPGRGPYGKIVSDWKGTPAGPFSLKVTIPANTSAQVFLPAITGAHLTEGGNSVDAHQEGGSYVVRVGAGSYRFEVK